MTKLPFQHDLTPILDSIIAISGAQGAAIVDARTGSCLAEKQVQDGDSAGQAGTMGADTLRTMTKLGRMMSVLEIWRIWFLLSAVISILPALFREIF